MIRTEPGCSGSRFAELVGVPRRTYQAGPCAFSDFRQNCPQVGNLAEASPATRRERERFCAPRGLSVV